MTVKYYHQVRDGNFKAHGNIIWSEDRDRCKFGMRYGKFPPNHPCAPGDARSNEQSEFGASPQLTKFRALGYWASCFPEGDGITMSSSDEISARQVAEDISDCFGWEVQIMREETGKQTGKVLATVTAVRP